MNKDKSIIINRLIKDYKIKKSALRKVIMALNNDNECIEKQQNNNINTKRYDK